MSLVIALAISIGVVSGAWMVIAYLLGLTGVSALMVAAWPAFIGMPLYFASGCGQTGLGKTMAANTGGVIVSMLMVIMAGGLSFLGDPLAIAIAVAVGSFIIVAYSQWAPLSYVPGGFAGCACAFGTGMGTDISMLIALLIAMYSGAALGYVADVWGNGMAKKSGKSETDAKSA